MRPVRCSTQTTRPPGRSSSACAAVTSRSEKSPVRGSSPVRSTTSTDRPSPALHGPVGRDHGPALGQGERRAGRDQHHRGPVTPAPLDHDVDGGPGRGPLLPVGLVVGVEHHRRRQTSDRRPGGGPGPHGHAAAPPRRRPSRPAARPRARPPSAAGSARCSARGREAATTSTPSGPVRLTSSRTSSDESSAGARRTTAGARTGQGGVDQRHRPAPGEAGGVGGRRCGPEVPHHPGRRCRAQEGGHRAGPAPRRPVGQGDHRRRRARRRSTPSSSSGCTPGSGVTSSSTTQAADPPAVEGDAHPAAHPDRRGQGSRHRVVEAPVDGRDVGHDPDDPGTGPARSPPPPAAAVGSGSPVRGRAPASGRPPGRCPPR